MGLGFHPRRPPSRARKATESGPGGCLLPRWGERYLRRAGFQNLTDLLGYIFILFIPEKVNENTHHIWRVDQGTALFEYGLKFLPVCMTRLAKSANGSMRFLGLLA